MDITTPAIAQLEVPHPVEDSALWVGFVLQQHAAMFLTTAGVLKSRFFVEHPTRKVMYDPPDVAVGWTCGDGGTGRTPEPSKELSSSCKNSVEAPKLALRIGEVSPNLVSSDELSDKCI